MKTPKGKTKEITIIGTVLATGNQGAFKIPTPEKYSSFQSKTSTQRSKLAGEVALGKITKDEALNKWNGFVSEWHKVIEPSFKAIYGEDLAEDLQPEGELLTPPSFLEAK